MIEEEEEEEKEEESLGEMEEDLIGSEDEYGNEEDEDINPYGEEDEEPQRKSKKSKDKKQTVFADYDEFASMLEDGLFDENKLKKYLPKSVGSKRAHGQRRN